MKISTTFFLLCGCALLGACGGGGSGGVTSTPAPAPAPAPTPTPSPTPTPTNSNIASLVASQSFSETATTTDITLKVSDGFVQSATAATAPLTISYDASTGNYTVTTGGRTQTFLPSDEMPQRWDGEHRYSKGSGSEHLTLVTNPYYGAQYSNKYVSMGYWQSNSISNGIQQTYFSTFTYGFDTAASAVPRSGAASWLTDIFGLLSIPGKEVRVVQGLGDFSVDFLDGTFVASAALNESNVVTNGGTSGSLRFAAGGYLDSSHGFSGLFSYNGVDTSLTGNLSGSFYGPNADEIGATFYATGGGNSLTGALTGQQFPVGSTSDGIKNISLTNLLADDRFYGPFIKLQWTETQGKTGYSSLVYGRSTGTVDVTKNGGTQGVGFDLGAYTIDPADLISSGPANFDTYRSTFNGNPLTVSFYKIGDANNEIALTYTSLVTWASSEDGAIPTGESTKSHYRQYLVYGLPSDVEVMAGRTGSASYAGAVYGAAADLRGGSWDITGTSTFSVDFSGETYSGDMMLKGTDQIGAVTDFGQWTFDGVLNYGGMVDGSMVGPDPATSTGTIYPAFYGPSGQEIGGPFSAEITGATQEDTIEMVGATVAKEQ